MTYFTDDHKLKPRQSRAGEKREYYAYFTLIFLTTLPLACLTWTLSATRRMELPERGPIKAAWRQAQFITPRIFSA